MTRARTEYCRTLRYDEDVAGGFNGNRIGKVNQNLSIISAVKEMRKQAEEMEEVYSIYVVDDSKNYSVC